MAFDDDPFGLNDPDPIMPELDLVSATVVGAWLGLTSTRVQQLARDGILTRIESTGQFRFDLKSTVQTYCDYTRSAAARRQADPDLAEQKLRLTRAQADRAEQQAARDGGTLLQADAVAAAWTSITTDLRAALLAIPERCAATLGLDRQATAALDSELRSCLEVIADDH